MKCNIIAVDYQNDFCHPNGKYYVASDCHEFIQKQLVPFLKTKQVNIAEIVCDYRLPRPHEDEAWCVPGEWGYLSAIDNEIKKGKTWVKGMHSPEWVRENGGNPHANPGLPYQDPQGFTAWLHETIGTPDESQDVILFGLTFDCCILQTAQQLHYRHYNVKILQEATDIYSVKFIEPWIKANGDYKNIFFNTTHWTCAEAMTWHDLQNYF